MLPTDDSREPLLQNPPPPAVRMRDVADGPPPDIAALTARMKRGDESAYRAFYDLYFTRLLRYLIVAAGGREDTAKEALQLTLLRVVRHIRPFPAEDVFWSWLTVLARSALIDEERKHRRQRSLLERLFFREPTPDPLPGDDAEARLWKLTEAALQSLPPADRELIRRKYFAGESVRDIAAETGTTEKAVESRLVRLRRHLKATLLTRLSDET